MQGGGLGVPSGMTRVVCDRLMRRAMESQERVRAFSSCLFDLTCVRGTQVSGSFKCWGRNLFGQLGLGGIRGDGPGEMGVSVPHDKMWP